MRQFENRFLPLELDPEQPVAAQNRSQQGVVSILNYNVFLRPELVTDPDTVRFIFQTWSIAGS